MSELTTRLRVLRAEKNVTQEDLARETGISYRAYNPIENGKAVPSLQTLLMLANYFDVSLDYLVGRSESRK